MPLLKAERGGLYGGPDRPTRLRAIKLIGEWKGVGKNNAGDQVPRPAAPAVCVVVTDEERAARIAGILSASGPAGVLIDVDGQWTKTRDEKDTTTPYKPVPGELIGCQDF